MNIEQLDTTRILISLCDKDMESYRVSFETLSLTERHSRRVLKELMLCASESTGISLEKKHVVIEALRYEHGCLLLLTITDCIRKRKIYKIKYYNDAYVFVFDDAESLLACIKALYRMSGTRFASSVFFYNNRYYLVLNSAYALNSRFINTIQEFCSQQKRGSALSASLNEHAKAISLKNAVETIGSKL